MNHPSTQPPPPATRRKEKSPESHLSFARRREAAEILQSYEKLSWLSFERCEVSIPQTRLYCQNIIAGFDEKAPVDWTEDLRPHQPRSGVRPDSARKGKARASLDDGQVGAESPAGARGRDGRHVGEGGSEEVQRKKKRKSGVESL
ncbi:hypothetical protein Tdes44962_MAKER03989 [Teratosphaeria destructans]|uniref:Uncharacterized protein n=1 Tax=Teratosphaeria destructans TaxID=418781 RepID=A0A9W7SP55_9PEZI|nr:hypothetical protein Tdes44962_MAKER03989 [Teratosphaeria destructans]